MPPGSNPHRAGGGLPCAGAITCRHRKLGREFGIEEGRQAARLSALNLIAHLRVALAGDLDRLGRCLRIAGYVNCEASFTDQSTMIDGASDLFVSVFGESGRHARVAIGVAALPYDVAVEVEGVFEIGEEPGSTGPGHRPRERTCRRPRWGRQPMTAKPTCLELTER